MVLTSSYVGHTATAVPATTLAVSRAAQLGPPSHAPGIHTVEAYLKGWLNTLPCRVKGSTVYRYRILVNGHMIPALGAKKRAELKPDAIAAFYAERQKSGLAPTTVQLIHTTLRKALRDAVEYGYIAYNPVARVKPPHRAELEPRVLTSHEVRRLLTTADVRQAPSGGPVDAAGAHRSANRRTPNPLVGRRLLGPSEHCHHAVALHRRRQARAREGRILEGGSTAHPGS
jgi:integrase